MKPARYCGLEHRQTVTGARAISPKTASGFATGSANTNVPVRHGKFRPFERLAVGWALWDGRGLTVAENKLSKYLFVYSRRQTIVNIQQPYLKAEMRAEALGFRPFERFAVGVTLWVGREWTIARNNR